MTRKWTESIADNLPARGRTHRAAIKTSRAFPDSSDPFDHRIVLLQSALTRFVSSQTARTANSLRIALHATWTAILLRNDLTPHLSQDAVSQFADVVRRAVSQPCFLDGKWNALNFRLEQYKGLLDEACETGIPSILRSLKTASHR
jgi:hypothetical protein